MTGASLFQLSALVDKSVLRYETTGRYELHELLRQYAAEKLEATPERATEVREQHASYYLGWLARLEIDFKGAGQVEAAERVARELENVRVAWYWAIIQRLVPELRRALVSLALFCDMRSRFQEGAELFTAAVDGLSSPPPIDLTGQVLLGVLLVVQGWFASRLYQSGESGRLTREGLALLEPLGSRWELAFAYQFGAFNAADDLEGELERFQRALQIYREHGDRWGEAVILESLGTLVFYRERDYGRAHRLLEESLSIRRRLGDRWGMAMVLFTLGALAQDRGKRREARDYYSESYELRRQIGDPWGMAICLDYLGYVLRGLGEYERARELHAESLSISRQIGDTMGIGGSLDNLGLVAYNEADYEEALRYFEAGLAERCQEEERHSDVALSLEHLGDLYLAQGELDAAERHYEESLQKYQRSSFDVHWGFVRAYHGRGRLALARGDRERAEVEFATALTRALNAHAHSLALEVFASVASLWLEEGHPHEVVVLLGAILENEVASYQTVQSARRLLKRASARLDDDALRVALAAGNSTDLRALIEQTAAKLAAQ